NPSMYSPLFFEGLRILCANLMRKIPVERLRQHSSVELSSIIWPKLGIEFASTLSRHSLFSAISRFLLDWPDAFIKEASRSRLSYAYLKGGYGSLPYWYENAIKKFLSRESLNISHREAETIYRAVESRFGKFSSSLARQISGRDISKTDYVKNKFHLTNESVELFLASIDHEIADTLDDVKRQEFLRDKIMFGVARGLGLTQKELSELTIEKVHELVPQKMEVSFYNAPKTNVQARAWADWYLNYTESLRCSDCKMLFFSFRTKKGINRRSISARFTRAKNVSGIRQEIRNYALFVKSGYSS
ncbi:MAG: hypothetical protein JAZ03_20250, partial [Candidatus Thiodiazotropha taylori]|nr:hypothetical protein [Candidatus Thiodiazotropha taylori]MCW4336260.1 hypothetical protein [Candidatus Thiodiazotropha endolucinida]